MLKLKSKTIAVTLGDPCGIGPEVVVKALKAIKQSRGIRFLIIGDQKIYKYYGGKLSAQISFCPVISSNKFISHVGRFSQSSGKISKTSLDYAIRLIKLNEVDALVTAPVSKEAISLVDDHFKGHTEYLANAFEVKNVEMMFVVDSLKLVIATRHIPIKDVANSLSTKRILDTILMTSQALKKLFKMHNPRIAVLGLNPHAGENGLIGQEDKEKILPAIRLAQKKRVTALGPLSADTTYIEHNRKNFDAIIAMYHDQGLAPIKAIFFNKLVNLTIGLPFIRTSPAHGTAFDIAGENKADPQSMVEAIKLAIQLSSSS